MNRVILQALRYAGAGANPDEETVRHMQALYDQTVVQVQPRAVWRLLPLCRQEGLPMIGGIVLPGEDAKKMLQTCTHAAIMAVTAGHVMDAVIHRAQARNMLDALLLDGLGSAMAEEKCDETQRQISACCKGKFLTDRFSPGYGDLPITLQPQLLRLVDAQRRVGITVSDRMMMTPFKSVTAIVGISDEVQPARIRGCSRCKMRESCTLRKGGKRCGE